jgi:hypothetical protein
MGVAISGLAATKGLMGDLARELIANPSPLLKVWGIRMVRETHDIIQSGGKPPWAPLAASTVSAKRQGKGSGGVKPLVGFRDDVDFRLSGDREVTIFIADRRAVFHEHGTKGPYEIKPKNAKALALPFLPGRDRGKGTSGSGKAGRFSLAGLGRATATGRGSFTTTGGAVRVPYTNVSFRKKVIHPGLKQRRLLPTEEQAIPLLQRETTAFVDHLVRRRSGGNG